MRLVTNESTADRVGRVVLAAVLAFLAITGVVSGAPAIVALLAAAVLVVTGAAGFCPLYAILRIGTKPTTR
jgi:hypothetical protein